MRGLLFFLVACPFVGKGDLEDRLDADGDSFPMGTDVGEDCDDTNPDIHPMAEEICDGIDNDCNPDTVDGGMSYPFYRDADGDGFGARVLCRRRVTPPWWAAGGWKRSWPPTVTTRMGTFTRRLRRSAETEWTRTATPPTAIATWRAPFPWKGRTRS